MLSWLASTRAANVHLAATNRAAFRRRSYTKLNEAIKKLCILIFKPIAVCAYGGCVLNNLRIVNESCMWQHLSFGKPIKLKQEKCCKLKNRETLVTRKYTQLTYPASVFLCAPNTTTLHAGIFDSFVNPPATPNILAAVDAPTIIDRFGAINVIRLSTYSKIFDL